jgi:Carboxypeptidase activation peptide
VYRTATLDASFQGKLDHLMARPEFDFWNMPRVGRQVDILVSPQHAQELELALSELGLHPTVINHNVG